MSKFDLIWALMGFSSEMKQRSWHNMYSQNLVQFGPLSGVRNFICHRPKILLENVLNLTAHAAAPREKYIRDWIVGWTWNHDSEISLTLP